MKEPKREEAQRPGREATVQKKSPGKQKIQAEDLIEILEQVKQRMKDRDR